MKRASCRNKTEKKTKEIGKSLSSKEMILWFFSSNHFAETSFYVNGDNSILKKKISTTSHSFASILLSITIKKKEKISQKVSITEML